MSKQSPAGLLTLLLCILFLGPVAANPDFLTPNLPTNSPAQGTDDDRVARLANLDLPLPAPAVTDRYLDRKLDEYLDRGTRSTERMLGRANVYFPVFEEYLAKYRLPSSLKYLAIAESMLVPGAKSSANAAGLWQLMPATAREMGLRVDGTVDERLDVHRSTEAAVLMLKQLHQQFGDWHLALAAYNAGPGRVRRAVAASGGYTRYAKVKPFLPRETQRYVAAYVAAAYTATYYGDYGLTPNEKPVAYGDSKAVLVRKNLSIWKLSKALDLPYASVRQLNPSFVRGFIPRTHGGYLLRVPTERAYDVRRYVWGQDNLVELPETIRAAEEAVDFVETTTDYDLLSLVIGVRPEALGHYHPSIAMNYFVAEYASRIQEELPIVAMNE